MRARPQPGWVATTVNEAAEFKRGLTWGKQQERDRPAAGLVPVLGIPNVQSRLELGELRYLEGVSEEARRRYRASKGFSLMVGSNGNAKRVGNCVFINESMEFVFASFLIAASSRNESFLHPAYLFRLLSSAGVQGAISDSVQGTTGLKNISLELLRGLPIQLPPLPEQRKIAAILSSVDDAIDKTQAVIDQLAVVKKAMMQDLLTKGLPGRHTRFKQTEIGMVPEEWEVVPLSHLARVKGGKRMPKGRAFANSLTPYPYIRVSDFADDTVRLENLKYVLPEDQIEIRAYTVASNDLYISIAGTLGVVGEIPLELDGAQLTENAAKICEIQQERVHKTYLMFALQSQRSQDQIDRLKGVGAGVPKLALFRIESILVAVAPLDEQVSAAELLAKITSRHRRENDYLLALAGLKASLQSVLLTGELRVTPDEDPA